MFTELAHGVFRRQYEFLSLNIGIVVADEGVLIVDTRESHEAADELIADVRTLTSLPIRWVINTHWHWDHAFGNARFPDATIWGHRICRERLSARPDDGRTDARMWMPEERFPEIDGVEVVPPTEVFEAITTLDLGSHHVTLSHHGRAHTDNDAIVTVGDVTFMGDIVEDGGAPYMGDGYLYEWPATLDAAASLLGATVVPGHGGVQAREWVGFRRADMARVAELLTEVLYEGRALEDAARNGPFPETAMVEGLTRGVALATGAPR